MSHDCCVALPHGATGCRKFMIVVFPDHTPLLALGVTKKNTSTVLGSLKTSENVM